MSTSVRALHRFRSLAVRFHGGGPDDVADEDLIFEESGPLDSLFACPDTGRFFSVCDAVLDVSPAVLLDARIFYCPSCDSTLKIGKPGDSPVAKCTRCSWTTSGSAVTCIPDLLTSENRPYRKASNEFEELQGIAGGLRPFNSEKAASSEVPSFAVQKATMACANSAIHGPEKHDDSLSQTETHLASHPSNPVSNTFGASVAMHEVLQRHEMLEAGVRLCASMPPRRKRTKPSFILRSPFSNRSVLPLNWNSCPREASTNASKFMPHFVVHGYVDMDRFVIRILLKNISSATAAITLKQFPDRLKHSTPVQWDWITKKECLLTSFDSFEVLVSCPLDDLDWDRRLQCIQLVEEVKFIVEEHSVQDDLSFSALSRKKWHCYVSIEIPQLPVRV
jgi:hypothetical protein